MTRHPLLLGSILCGAIAWAGCASDPRVVRVYDGKLVEGRYVTPDGYAAYLRAVLAEESGDLKGALSQLQMAVAEDDDDAEVWARVGEVRCKASPNDKEADDAFARALKADPGYAGALAAKGRCALLRGKHEEAAELAKRGLAADPGNVTLDALLVRADARRPNAQLRERAIALTVAHAERAAAWDALVAWSRARHDADLLARGLEGLLRAAPTRLPEVERGALDLLGEGHLALARRVAASITDAPPQLLVRAPHDPTVGRLAVDLAARGVLPEAALGPELRIELAARRREPPPRAPKDADVDPRHELLFYALTDPSGAAAKSLAANLGSAIDRDPIVAFATARIALASGPSGQGTLDRLRQALSAAPGNALLLSALVEIAKSRGRADELQPARTRLMAVARTPAERALATE